MIYAITMYYREDRTYYVPAEQYERWLQINGLRIERNLGRHLHLLERTP